jgi:hypothetical protein
MTSDAESACVMAKFITHSGLAILIQSWYVPISTSLHVPATVSRDVLAQFARRLLLLFLILARKRRAQRCESWQIYNHVPDNMVMRHRPLKFLTNCGAVSSSIDSTR